MHAPVLVTPPAGMPVTLDEAKLHLRVDGDEEDTLITALIAGAVSYLDGWTGVLGGALADQTWRQDFDSFACTMRLPIGPVSEIVSITYRTSDGQVSTVADSNFALVTDAIGPRVFWDAGFSAPGDLYEQGAVSVTYQAGYAEAPAALKIAILLMVGHWYTNRETVAEGSFSELPFAANVLLAPFRRMSI
ncbi:MAG: head-tail connector protein [Cypionkella sp.]